MATPYAFTCLPVAKLPFHFVQLLISRSVAGRHAPQTWRPLLHWRSRWRACGSS